MECPHSRVIRSLSNGICLYCETPLVWEQEAWKVAAPFERAKAKKRRSYRKATNREDDE
jgi:hypothetical protein